MAIVIILITVFVAALLIWITAACENKKRSRDATNTGDSTFPITGDDGSSSHGAGHGSSHHGGHDHGGGFDGGHGGDGGGGGH